MLLKKDITVIRDKLVGTKTQFDLIKFVEPKQATI